MTTKPGCAKTRWNGREAYTLSNDRVQMVTLPGGGHISEFQFLAGTGLPTLNPLWVPPWKSIEPTQYRAAKHTRTYGTLSEGKLLSGIAGHNICLDNFGPPSEEEAEQGLSTHGEAPSSHWKKARLRATPSEVGLTLEVRLPVAGLKFSRQIRLRRGESVAYFTETVSNEKKADHLFHWAQHVTLGPPFIESDASRVSLPGTRGRTHASAYGDVSLLASSRNFHWPLAPARTGGNIDLTQPLSQPGTGMLASVLLNARRSVAYVAALNQTHRLVIGYCFRRIDFPWVAIWEENKARTNAPWNGRAQTRGLEFSSTPTPTTRREAFANSPLFGTPTYSIIPAKGKKTVHYASFLAQVPEDFGWIRDIQTEKNEIILQGTGRRQSVRLAAAGLADNGW